MAADDAIKIADAMSTNHKGDPWGRLLHLAPSKILMRSSEDFSHELNRNGSIVQSLTSSTIMFRKISYSMMVATVFLSWGLMLRVAYSEDRAGSSSFATPRAIANVAPKTLAIPGHAPTVPAAKSTYSNPHYTIDTNLPRVKKALTSTTSTVKVR